MSELVELAEALDREAAAVRGRAAHHEEQGQLDLAASELQIAYGLRLVAHVISAMHELED